MNGFVFSPLRQLADHTAVILQAEVRSAFPISSGIDQDRDPVLAHVVAIDGFLEHAVQRGVVRGDGAGLGFTPHFRGPPNRILPELDVADVVYVLGPEERDQIGFRCGDVVPVHFATRASVQLRLHVQNSKPGNGIKAFAYDGQVMFGLEPVLHVQRLGGFFCVGQLPGFGGDADPTIIDLERCLPC